MTKAQQTYERINALVDGGMQKAEAFKQLAGEYGQPVTSVRGAYYGHKRVLERGDEPSTRTARRSRKRETTTQDAVASAVASLRGDIESILRRYHVKFEMRSVGQKEIVYDSELPLHTRTDRIANAILAVGKGSDTEVAWEEKKTKK